MNPQLKEINEIITICDSMIYSIRESGNLRTGDQNYEKYKRQIYSFLTSHGLKRKDYAPYVVLNALFFNTGSYSVNMSEAQTIRSTILSLKHELFPDAFEKVFISHREKDDAQVAEFINLLYAIGIPRPTVCNDESVIFCTSHPASYIENGARNLDEIKAHFNSPEHTYFILWYTGNYFESQACLNEAGAIWATGKKYQEILAPGFSSSKIGGLLDKQPVWFRANDKFRLNTFKEKLEAMFGLDPLTQNAWEIARDSFITKIENYAKDNCPQEHSVVMPK